MQQDMFFGGWEALGRVLVVGFLAYAGLVVLLRVTGKRTLSKMNAFDLVVTVALGSSLATTLLSKQVALVEGLTAFALLILLQLAVTWASVRAPRFQQLIKAQPTLLVYQGKPLAQAMCRERVSEEELHAALRDHGLARVEEVAAAVLETDGTVTVLAQEVDPRHATAMTYVSGHPEPQGERLEPVGTACEGP